jgi:hypothetical protein
MSEYRFLVGVPVEPVLHESLEGSSTYQLPTGRFGEFDVSREESMYVFRLECLAASPLAAMRTGLERVGDLLNVLATSNDAFRIRAASIEVENLGPTGPQPGEQLFISGFLGTSKLKGSLHAEVDAVAARDRWPDYLRDALELNYLAVIAERPITRWLLEVIALERLTVGRLRPRTSLLSRRLKPNEVQDVRGQLVTVVAAAGFSEAEVERVISRVLATEDRSAQSQITEYLDAIGVEVDPGEPAVWWRLRGGMAHGNTEPVDTSALSRLVSRTQLALRFELGSLG